jgi:hypothetical protein
MENETTTVKIKRLAQSELKRFVADQRGKLRMEDITSVAVVEYLKLKGHKFYSTTLIKKMIEEIYTPKPKK